MTFTTDRRDSKGKLRRAAGDAQDAGRHVKRAAAAQAGRVQDTLQSSADLLRSRARGLAETTQHRVRSGQDRALRLARERPIASAAVVAGLTVLAALLFANRTRLTQGAADLQRTTLRRSRLRHRT